MRIAEAQGRVRVLGCGIGRGVGRRLGLTDGRAERTEMLHAAHTAIVVLAWVQSLEGDLCTFASTISNAQTETARSVARRVSLTELPREVVRQLPRVLSATVWRGA
ncbi:hypothetical protein ACIQVC_25810 [Streptomyces sp. NPDC101112]|uniref:NACHT N-terminal helical domain 7-containing protein n=1 Tax=Streptomyces sp. NPDC101112 TaxID=3366105 RepID=UPI00380B40B9